MYAPVGPLATAACALLVLGFRGVVSAQNTQEPRDCFAPAQRSGSEPSSRRYLLTDPGIDPLSKYGETYTSPSLAALYNTSRACCPSGSFIVEWEVVLKTFYAPHPFDDGRNRSLNGTELPDNITRYLRIPNSRSAFQRAYNDYSSWNATEQLSWEDVQGLALTTLHNKTILGSLQAKCGLKNGTIVAELPKIGANKTSDCLDVPDLTILESPPIRVINSSLPTGVFLQFFYNNFLKVPKNLEAVNNFRSTDVAFIGQDSPYQDWMGLMNLLDLSAVMPPAVVDLADYDWTDELFAYSRDQGFTGSENSLSFASQSAAVGLAGVAGCFGPTQFVAFDEKIYLDTPPTPEVPSYGNCSYNASDQQTYASIGQYMYTDSSRLGSRFQSRQLVCCPEGQYVQELALQFRGDLGFSNPDRYGVFRQRLWSFTGICSRGTRLPEISLGDGCTGSGRLLPPQNYTARIAYEDNSYGPGRTAIYYGYDGYGFLQFAGVGPNMSLAASLSRDVLGIYDSSSTTPPPGSRLRIVGLNATASCDGIASLGMILRTRDQVNEPGGGLSPGAIAGIVVGAVAFLALVAALVVVRWRRRSQKVQGFEESDI